MTHFCKSEDELNALLAEHSYSTETIAGIDAWDVRKLWTAAEYLPVQVAPVDKFNVAVQKWINFETEVAPDGRRIAQFDVDHFRRIKEANLAYPIILSATGNIMDGMHRLMKCYLTGADVAFVQFEQTPPPELRYNR